MKVAESVDVRPLTWLPYVNMQFLTEVCEMKVIMKGDKLSVPGMAGQKFEVEVVSFKPYNESQVQVRKWTEFRVLKKDSMEIDHFYDPDPEQEIRRMLGKREGAYVRKKQER